MSCPSAARRAAAASTVPGEFFSAERSALSTAAPAALRAAVTLRISPERQPRSAQEMSSRLLSFAVAPLIVSTTFRAEVLHATACPNARWFRTLAPSLPTRATTLGASADVRAPFTAPASSPVYLTADRTALTLCMVGGSASFSDLICRNFETAITSRRVALSCAARIARAPACMDRALLTPNMALWALSWSSATASATSTLPDAVFRVSTALLDSATICFSSTFGRAALAVSALVCAASSAACATAAAS